MVAAVAQAPAGWVGELDGADEGGTDEGGTDEGGTDDGGTDEGGTDDGGGGAAVEGMHCLRSLLSKREYVAHNRDTYE